MRKQIHPLLWLWLLLFPALALAAPASSPTAAPAPKGSPPAAPKGSSPPAPAAKATPPVAKATPPVASAPPPKKPAVTAPAPAAAPPPKAVSPAKAPPKSASPAAAPKAAPPAHTPKAAPAPKKPTAHSPPPAHSPASAHSPAKAHSPAPAHSPAKAHSPASAHSPAKAHSPKAAPSPKKAASPASSPHHSPASPAAAPAASPDSQPNSLRASQITALHSLGVDYSKPDPCESPKDVLICDKESPRHVVALSLYNCSKTAKLSTQALVNLSSLTAISFEDCPMVPVHVPSILVKSLTSFICTESLGKTGTNEKAEKLSGVWLSKLKNLNVLSVTSVEISASGLTVITGGLKSLSHLTIASTSIGGVLPKKTWPPDVELIDVSGNSIRGTMPSQMRLLSSLKHLDLSDNQIKGVVPNIFDQLSSLQYINLAGNQFSGPIPGSLAQLRNCSHLDLSNNKLNGSVLANISSLRTLKYLDLSQNQLTGQIPFNSTFLKRLTTFKIGSNPGLCYNHTAIKSKFLTGIPNCASPVSDYFAPAPAPALSEMSTSSGGGSHLSKGAIAGISVVVILVGGVVFFGVTKWWKARKDPDTFVNLRAQRS